MKYLFVFLLFLFGCGESPKWYVVFEDEKQYRADVYYVDENKHCAGRVSVAFNDLGHDKWEEYLGSKKHSKVKHILKIKKDGIWPYYLCK